jgi:hypothetical protein
MTDQEVNKIIAEFMGKWVEQLHLPHKDGYFWVDVMSDNMEKVWEPPYTRSLDALIPVWGKLVDLPFFDMQIGIDTKKYGANFKAFTELLERTQGHSGWHDTIQQAAAHATAKAINELQEK